MQISGLLRASAEPGFYKLTWTKGLRPGKLFPALFAFAYCTVLQIDLNKGIKTVDCIFVDCIFYRTVLQIDLNKGIKTERAPGDIRRFALMLFYKLTWTKGLRQTLRGAAVFFFFFAFYKLTWTKGLRPIYPFRTMVSSSLRFTNWPEQRD